MCLLMKKYIFFFLLFFCSFSFLSAQNKFIIQNKKHSNKIKFRLLNNLIIVPVEVNGVELSFILDTGVSKPIIFNFVSASDTLKIKHSKKLFIRGLGAGEPIEASRSRNNIFRIGDAVKQNQDLYAVYGLDLNLGQRLGIPIHGLIGLDLFRDFVVEINYGSQNLILYENDTYRYKKCRNCERFVLEFHNNKPYINAQINITNKEIPVKLLIDSGGSDSLWLFEEDSLGINSGDKYFRDFLGHGLSGSVYGKRGKAKSFFLNTIEIKNPNVAYPDSMSIVYAKKIRGRNGSLAGNILKRFNVVMDYRNSFITLKKNSNFKEPFRYNKSGIELAHSGSRLIKMYEPVSYSMYGSEHKDFKEGARVEFNRNYKLVLKPAYQIVELRKGSPAEEAGLKKGDIVLTVNGKPSHEFTLQDITIMFYGNENKSIRMKVERKGEEEILEYSFRLKDILK